MKYRKLGKTNLKVAEVGIGTWQLAGDPEMWVKGSLTESIKSLHKYVELGGNFIDTAWVYGYEEGKKGTPDKHASHELIAKFLKETGKRNDLIIATKVAPKNWHWPAWKHDKLTDCFPVGHIEKQVDECLMSLGVDYLDLVQFHVWNDAWARQASWQKSVEKLISSGKVRYWGISINDYQPSNCLNTLDTGLISTIQFIFNIFHQKPTEKLLPYAKKNNIGLIARVPLDEGGLTGKFTKNTKFQKGDFRQHYFKGTRLLELVEHTNELKKIAKGEGGTLTELSLRWLLSHPEVSTVIPGMRKVSYVKGNLKASDKGKLSAKVMKELSNHVWERNFYAPGEADPGMKDDGYIEI